MNIELQNINYIYNISTPEQKQALFDINLKIGQGEFIALVGGTGSGKSTLVQILNGLIVPTSGEIYHDGKNVGGDKKELRKIRCSVGLVFQYPEYQLFEETVLKDVAYGPKNKGFDTESALNEAKAALKAVGLNESFYDKSPFELSGGEKRRAAIAGVLAMRPEILIMDEPTAGLDPEGKQEILNLIKKYHEEKNITVILVSHSMEEVAQYAERVIVMRKGNVILDDEVHEVFEYEEELKSTGLELPQVAVFAKKIGIEKAITIDEVFGEIIKLKK